MTRLEIVLRRTNVLSRRCPMFIEAMPGNPNFGAPWSPKNQAKEPVMSLGIGSPTTFVN
jgi:hypothetical protein